MTENNTLTRSQSFPTPLHPQIKVSKSVSFVKPSTLRREESIIYFDPVEEEKKKEEIMSSNESQSENSESESYSDDSIDQSDIEIDVNILDLINGVENDCIVDGNEHVYLDNLDYIHSSSCNPFGFV